MRIVLITLLLVSDAYASGPHNDDIDIHLYPTFERTEIYENTVNTAIKDYSAAVLGMCDHHYDQGEKDIQWSFGGCGIEGGYNAVSGGLGAFLFDGKVFTTIKATMGDGVKGYGFTIGGGF